MTITIIGGNGFLGTRLTKRLLDAGHTVRIADKRKSHTLITGGQNTLRRGNIVSGLQKMTV